MNTVFKTTARLANIQPLHTQLKEAENNGKTLIVTQARRSQVEQVMEKGFIVYDGTVGAASVPAFVPSLAALTRHLDNLKTNGLAVRYGTTLGEREFKERALPGILRAYPYSIDDAELTLKRVAFFPGAHFGIAATLTAILKNEKVRGNANSVILMQSPGYPSYKKLFDEARKSASLNEQEATLAFVNVPKGYPEADEIRKSIDENEAHGRKIGALLLTIPSNPQGKIPPREDLVKIINLISTNRELHIVLDETFLEIDFRKGNKDRFKSMTRIAQEMAQEMPLSEGAVFLKQFLDRVFIIRSGTKAAAIAGYRPNLMILARDEGIVNSIYEYTSTLLSNTGFAEQILMAEWMRSSDESDYEEISDHYQKNLGFLTDTLESLNIPYIRPDGGFFISIDLGMLIGRRVPEDIVHVLKKLRIEDDEDLFNLLLKVGHENERLGIMPGRDFGYATTDGWIRFCFGLGEKRVKGAARVIEKIVDKIRSYAPPNER